MKRILVVFLLFVGISYASAQEVYTSSGKPGNHKKAQKNKKKGYDPDRLIVGGGITLNFGGGYAALGAAPMVGYRILDKLSAGVGIGYLYAQRPVPDLLNANKDYFQKGHILYPSVWARYFVFRNFFVSTVVEYDFIFLRRQGIDNFGNSMNVKTNVTNLSLLPGCGFRIPLGGRLSAFVEARMDVLNGKYSQYPPMTPMFNFGFAAGL